MRESKNISIQFGQRPATPTRVTRDPLNSVGLFAGVGGLELGLARAGHVTNLLVEIEPAARAVLQARMSSIDLHDDVCTLRSLPKQTELLVGGFPCQDLSQAGQTRGIEGARSGLVGEVFRLLKRKRVPWVLLENVPFMLQLSRGRAMEVLVSAFEDLGYRWAYRVVNTRAFGLPQRRERVLFLASKNEDPRDVLFADDAGEPPGTLDGFGKVACGFYWTEGTRGLGWAVDAVPTLKGGSSVGIASPPAIVLPDGSVVTPDIRDAERMQGFEVDWTSPAESVARKGQRWKLVGNAVTVDVAGWLGQRLRAPDETGRHVGGCQIAVGRPWPRAAWNVGDGRFMAEVSAFPIRTEGPRLHEWLLFEPKPLSEKAALGFLSRAEQGSLRFPDGFLDAIRAHVARMQSRTTNLREAIA